MNIHFMRNRAQYFFVEGCSSSSKAEQKDENAGKAFRKLDLCNDIKLRGIKSYKYFLL